MHSLRVFFPADESYAETDIFVCNPDGSGCTPRVGQQVTSPHLAHPILLTNIAIPGNYYLDGDGFPVDPKTGQANGTMWIDRNCANARAHCVETGTMVGSLVFQSYIT